tara:strand:- start:211 stop:408 length:198 start_codon:yes stop_codon:yes gene_type:complete
MAQFEGESDLEYLGRRLRVLQDSGLKLTAPDIIDGFRVFEAPLKSNHVDAVLDRIERVARKRQRQ